MKNCLEVVWDTWNDWSKDNTELFSNGAKSSNKCHTEDCNVTGTGTIPKKGIGNGEKKLAMELLGNTEVGGGSKVSDITDMVRPHNFGHISIKEYGCKDVRLGTQVASSYHKFKASFFPCLCNWLLHCYYQNEKDKSWKQSAWTQQYASIMKIRSSGQEGYLIEEIRSTLYDRTHYKIVKKQKQTFILHDDIILGAVCAISKIDAYKKLILKVQELINLYREKFHNAIVRRLSIDNGIPTDLTRFYYIKPEDFEHSGDKKQVPDYIRDINFIALFIAVEANLSIVETNTTCLDEMVRTEALGGKLLKEAIDENREEAYQREEDKPVLIYVHEKGFFPVGSLAYNDIICDRISEDKPKIGNKEKGLITSLNEGTQLGKHKASGKSPASAGKSSGKSPAAAGKSSGKSPAAKKQRIESSQSSS